MGFYSTLSTLTSMMPRISYFGRNPASTPESGSSAAGPASSLAPLSGSTHGAIANSSAFYVSPDRAELEKRKKGEIDKLKNIFEQNLKNSHNKDEYLKLKEVFDALIDDTRSKNFDFRKRTIREILSEIMNPPDLYPRSSGPRTQAWVNSSRSSSKINALLESAEILFKPLINALMNIKEYEDPDNIISVLVKLNYERIFREAPSQKDFDFIIDLNRPMSASTAFNIDIQVMQLRTVYREMVLSLSELQYNLDEYISRANQILGMFFSQELSVLNADQTPINPQSPRAWGQPSAQSALKFYFDQRAVLYEIHMRSRINPEKPEIIDKKLVILKEFRDYLLETYARKEDYLRSYQMFGQGPVLSLGLSRGIKIESAWMMYNTVCSLPNDVKREAPTNQLRSIILAGETGRLMHLKAKCLYLGYGQGEPAFVPFNPDAPLSPEPFELSVEPPKSDSLSFVKP